MLSERVKNILVSNGLPPLMPNNIDYYGFLDQATGNDSQHHQHHHQQLYIGTSILHLATKLYVSRRFPTLPEKELAIKEKCILQYPSMLSIAKALGFGSVNVFYAFLGAVFFDYNDSVITDAKKGWFRDLFIASGPGFQMVELFVQNVFDSHVNWEQQNNNDKQRIRTILLKHFATPPFYFVHPQEARLGKKVSIYLCLGGLSPLEMTPSSLPTLIDIKNSVFQNIKNYLESTGGKGVVLLGSGFHKTSKAAAEKRAEESALRNIDLFF